MGVWLSAGRSLALRIAAAGMIGKEIEGVVVQLFFPMHQRGVGVTSNDPMHGVLTYVASVCCAHTAPSLHDNWIS